MSSKRHQRRRQCEGKAGHATEADARIARSRTPHAAGDRLHPYLCRFCHRWHLGHTPGSAIRAMRAAGRTF